MLKAEIANQTRQELLGAALDEVHRHGFQSASLSRILERTGHTKGALYHHFKNKNALGYAIVDELLAHYLNEYWIDVISQYDDPVTGIKAALMKNCDELGDEVLELGCPLNNLAQEMSPIDEGFRVRINHLYQLWEETLIQALQKGQMSGALSQNFNATQVGRFILASIEGTIGIAKNAQSKQVMVDSCAAFENYLDSLKK